MRLVLITAVNARTTVDTALIETSAIAIDALLLACEHMRAAGITPVSRRGARTAAARSAAVVNAPAKVKSRNSTRPIHRLGALRCEIKQSCRAKADNQQ